MADIHLELFIHAPVNIVFDLGRSIDLHQQSVKHTREQAIAGTTSGLIGLNEAVTWQAYHLFKTRLFTSRIVAMENNKYFRDEMQQGDFKKFIHEHFFQEQDGGTLMTDKLIIQSPYGIAGLLIDQVFMKQYIRRLLIKRNNFIKIYAESGAWQKILQYT